MKTSLPIIPRHREEIEVTEIQRTLLVAIIAETHRQGPPTLKRAASLIQGDEAVVHKALVDLAVRGHLRQHYDGGPWIPTRSPEGEPLTLALSEGEDNNMETTMPTMPSIPKPRYKPSEG